MITGSGVEDLTVGGKVFMYLFGPAIKTRKGRSYEPGSSVLPSLQEITERWTDHSDWEHL
jgi:hypothetical protein